MNETLSGGAANDTLSGGNGNDTIDGNQGADLMLGGNGRDLLIWDPGDGSDVLDGGNGFDTHLFNTSAADETINLFGRDGHAILTRNVGSITMDIDNVERVIIGGGGGADRILVGDLRGTDVRQVEAQGGAGNDTLDASDASSRTYLTLSGGEGSDRFVFAAGHGRAEIVDFQAHQGGTEGDLIVLSGAADANFDAAVANHHIFQAGADVVISGLEGGVVTLQGVSLANLGASDFLFT